MRTLVAGFGNPLRGDDGFGVAVLERLERQSLGDDVHLIDVGTGGIHLAHELLSGYDRVIIVDAMTYGATPGTLRIEELVHVEAESRIDLHLVVPARALGVAKALGVLPAKVLFVGCEPASVDELELALSPSVSAAADRAVNTIVQLLKEDTVAEGVE
jgi:hydrogenase maturation protease